MAVVKDYKVINLESTLSNYEVEAYAPSRIDLGGGVDHRLISLLCRSLNLCTFNISLCLYSRVKLEPFKKGYICITSHGIGETEYEASFPTFDGDFTLVKAFLSYFNVSGVKVSIKNDFPSFSGLGGSGALSVAVIAALLKVIELAGVPESHSQKDIVWIAHSIEDSLYKNTGLQDQSAAVYGGINILSWCYERVAAIFERESISINSLQEKNLEDRICLFYTGKPHEQTLIGSRIIHEFKNNPNGLRFIEEINSNTKQFIAEFKNGNWKNISKLLDQEETLRSGFLNYPISKSVGKVLRFGRKVDCGIKFCGGGGGGCMWAFGEADSIKELKDFVLQIGELTLLPFNINTSGVQVKTLGYEKNS